MLVSNLDTSQTDTFSGCNRNTVIFFRRELSYCQNVLPALMQHSRARHNLRSGGAGRGYGGHKSSSANADCRNEGAKRGPITLHTVKVM